MRNDQPRRLAGPLPNLPVVPVQIDHLDPNPFQPRLRPPSAEDLAGLVAAIRESGFRGAILVRRNPVHLAKPRQSMQITWWSDRWPRPEHFGGDSRRQDGKDRRSR
jgi:hypothetical protein